MHLQIETDDIPERRRFTAWAETVHSQFGLEARPLPGAAQPFRGRFHGRASGPLTHFSVDADAHRIAGRMRRPEQRIWDGYRIYCEGSAGAWFRLVNREGVTRPGDIVVYDADLPFETQPRDVYRHQMWIVPKAVLAPFLPATGRMMSMMLSGRDGVDALARSYLHSLARNWDSISETTMTSVADTLARLIGIACGAAAEDQPDAVRAGRLVQARQHIDRQLADPALSPASVAAALGISVRSLHLLFEPTGSSFARHVQRRRLEECRRALRASPTRPVIDIAFAWGFSSLSGFYRAFNAAFGQSPGEVRARLRYDRHP